MREMTAYKLNLIRTMQDNFRAIKIVIEDDKLILQYITLYDQPGWTTRQIIEQMQLEIQAIKEIQSVATDSQVILFPSDQAEVFFSAIDRYDMPLDYRLPFSRTMIQFTNPVNVEVFDKKTRKVIKDKISALLLSQDEIDLDWVLASKQRIKNQPFNLLHVPDQIMDGSGFLNGLHGIFTDWNNIRLSWRSESQNELVSLDADNDDANRTSINIKRLAIACIGYINCENVYLHSVESATLSINAKRERKGKSRLEPYYVCRIRGVQYDSAGNPTGEGAKHGIRYDVRGHFRRMMDGRTTWVRAHQRGLANELYVPKTYVVDKKEF